jgi:hypothetical protein
MTALKYYPMKLSKAGVPIDTKDWTALDWQDLHEGILAIQKRIAARHKLGTDRCKAAEESAQSS